MLPKIISSNYGSLIENTMRMMISLKIQMCCKTNRIISTDLRKTYGKITKNYSYDNYPKYVDKFNTHIAQLYHSVTNSIINITDSHKFIEAIMIIYNTIFSKTMIAKMKKPIYRIQEHNLKKPDSIDNDKDIDKCLDKFLSIIKSRSAEYSVDSKIHSSLQIHEYAHATSPLRRIVDLINQEIFYRVDSNLIKKFPINKINTYNKSLSYAYRDLNKLMLAYMVYNSSTYYTKCYIYDVDTEKKNTIFILSRRKFIY